MIALAVLLVLATFRWMRTYTRHGQYISVPDVSGMFEDEGAALLAKSGLRYEVSDYRYDRAN